MAGKLMAVNVYHEQSGGGLSPPRKRFKIK